MAEQNLTKHQRIALREAARAVVCYVLEIELDEVNMIRTDDRQGRVRTRYDTLPDAWVALDEMSTRTMKDIMARLAGPVTDAAVGQEMDAHDMAVATDLAVGVTSSKQELRAFLNWLLVRTKQLLQLPSSRAATEALATYLLRKRQLTSEEARGIIRMGMTDKERVLTLLGQDEKSG